MAKVGPPCLLWRDLTPEHLVQLERATNETETLEVLRDALRLAPTDDPAATMRNEVLLEFFLTLMRYANQHQLSAEKTSTFFSLMKQVNYEMTETFMPAQRTWKYFEALLLSHCVQRPPYSVGIFSKNDMVLVTQFALEHYFRCFQLFRYAFTMRHMKEITLRNSWIELPPSVFPSLVDGVPCDDAAAETDAKDEAETPPAPPPPPPPPEPDFSELELPPNVLQSVQEALRSQVTAVRNELEEHYSKRSAGLEEQIARLEKKK